MFRHETTAIVPERVVDLDVRPLGRSDQQWLLRMGVEWPQDETDWLDGVNALAQVGDMHIQPGMDDATTDSIMRAREEFLALMSNISVQAIESLRSINQTLMPTGTIIGTQRVLATHEIDGLAVNDFPGLLAYGPAGMADKLQHLQTLGIDVPRVVEKFPSILSYRPDTLKHKIELLSSLGMDATTTLVRYPRILMIPDQQIHERAAAFRKHGLSVSDVVEALPSLMSLLPETIDKKITDLRQLGIKPGTYEKNLVMLAYATESVEEKLRFYEGLGFDATALVNKAPESLNYSQAAIESKIRNLNDLGLNADVIITKHPIVLYYSETTLASKVRSLLESGITVAAIERGPAIVNMSEASINEKLAEWDDMGLNAPLIINSHPALLNLSRQNIEAKLAFLDERGFDARLLVHKKPSILALTPDTVAEKLRIAVAAARAWGWGEPDQQAIRLITEWPMLLTYSPAKLRTTARLATEALGQKEGASVSGVEISSMVTVNIEQAIVAFLEHGAEIAHPRDVVRLSKQYKSLGKQALTERIAAVPDSTVTRAYFAQTGRL
jgi:hypothetical protein